jgi:hypothetical protein
MMEVDRNGSPDNDKMEDDDSENEESGNPLAKSDSWDDQVKKLKRSYLNFPNFVLRRGKDILKLDRRPS